MKTELIKIVQTYKITFDEKVPNARRHAIQRSLSLSRTGGWSEGGTNNGGYYTCIKTAKLLANDH